MPSSFDAPEKPESGPSDWVARFLPLTRPGGRVLDVACGRGRHAILARSMGYQVTGIDIDTAQFAGPKDVTLVRADLEDGDWPLPPGKFDALVVTNYLHRPQFPHYVAALAEGGLLIIETFGAGNADYGRPRNPDFLLTPGELYAAFAGALAVLAYEHGVERLPRPAVRQRLCAIKAAHPAPLVADAERGT